MTVEKTRGMSCQRPKSEDDRERICTKVQIAENEPNCYGARSRKEVKMNVRRSKLVGGKV